MSLPTWADRLTLPSDASNTGKPTAFYPVSVSGGQVFIPATVISDTAGNSVESSIADPTPLQPSVRGVNVRVVGGIPGNDTYTNMLFGFDASWGTQYYNCNHYRSVKIYVQGGFGGSLTVNASFAGKALKLYGINSISGQQITPTTSVALSSSTEYIFDLSYADTFAVVGSGISSGTPNIYYSFSSEPARLWGATWAMDETAGGYREANDSVIRLLDTSQSAGSQLVLWKGDQTSGAWVNVKSMSGISQLPAALVSGRLDVNVGASTTVPVSGTFWQATQPISASALPLPSGAATETTLSGISGKLPASIGQKLMSASLPVVFASDQSMLSMRPTLQNDEEFPPDQFSAFVADESVWRLGGTAAIRLYDSLQGVGSRLVRLRGDETSGAWVNIKASISLPVTGTFWQATQPVSGTFWQATQPVSGTFWQATQPISAVSLPLPTGATQQTTLAAISAQLPTALVGARLDVNLGAVGNSVITLKALPANADGQAAIPVWNAAIQMATYDAGVRAIVSGALVANTAKAVLSFEHGATAVKRVKIRRIFIGGIQTAAVAGMVDIRITRGTAASSAGTARVPTQRKSNDPACECVVKSLPTIVAATVVDDIPWGSTGAVANTAMPTLLIYDWQEAGESKAYELRAGVLESFVVNVISSAAQNLTMTLSIDFTEE